MKQISRPTVRLCLYLSVLLMTIASCAAPKKYGCPNHLQAAASVVSAVLPR